jgi:hypothetical protein
LYCEPLIHIEERKRQREDSVCACHRVLDIQLFFEGKITTGTGDVREGMFARNFEVEVDISNRAIADVADHYRRKDQLSRD